MPRLTGDLLLPPDTNYTESPEEKWLDIADMSVHYLSWEIGGDPIIALHGLASSSQWYMRLARHMQEPYKIIAPDQRGHGETSQISTGFDWDTLSADIISLMDYERIDKATIIGHSWGGHVASNVAAKYPDRISNLILIDGGFQDGHLLPNSSWDVFRHRFAPRDVSGNRKQFLDRMKSNLSLCWDEDLQETVLSMVYEDTNGAIHDRLRPDNHSQLLWTMWSEPPSVVLPHIQCPTLIVAAGPRPDRSNSEFARMREVMVTAASNSILNCEVIWIPDTIHDIGYHKPDVLANVIKEFLSGHP